MKILIVTDTYPPHVNGAAQFTYRLAQALARLKHDVAVIAPSRTWRNEQYQDNGVRVAGVSSVPLYVNNMRVALPVFSYNFITQTIQTFAPDVVHVQGHFGLSQAVVKIAKTNSVPVVGTNHFMPDNLTNYLRLPNSIEQRLNKKLWRQSYAFFESLDAVTTPTHKAAKIFTRHGFHKPVQVISNGVDIQMFRPNHETRYLKAKYNLPDKLTALVVGRLDKEKNVDVIIRAVASARKHVDIHLIVAGSDKGSEARHLRQLTKQLRIADAVMFTGFVPNEDLPALYCCADVFVMAGTAELQSIVTMEAMASGLPIIAADAVALPELVTDGENGFLFESNNLEYLSLCITQILTDSKMRKRMGAISCQRIKQHALNNTLNLFEKIYTAVRKL